MRAVALNAGQLVVRDDVADPEPVFGTALVQVKACGICGSDLHFAKHGADMLALTEAMEGMPAMGDGPMVDLARDVYMGHEFAAEVLELGPDTTGPAPGTVVTSLPVLMTMTGIAPIVYSNTVASGYGERMLLSAPFLLEVPNGLDPKHAALTEPMAVGLHAVNKSGIAPGTGAVVLGCGPVGQAVVAALAMKGIEPIIATDFSPSRRALALQMGAHEALDPREETAWAGWSRAGKGGPPVVFEAIGVPGIIDDALRAAPSGSRVVVVGVCMQPDTINPFFAISKELNIQFVLGYDPMEFAECLRAIAEGDLAVAPLITGEVGLDGVAGAFDALADPDQHCKILVVP
jgi:threonine dehydrogenase-like Zn-dependent dehydrogenase